jgi:dihydropteroate synthase
MMLVEQGADIIDVGGESSRPGSEPVTVEEEIRRVVPVIEQVTGRTEVPVSIDSTKSDVVRRALGAGATWVNDISAGRFDPEVAAVAAQANAPVVLMHSRETPKTMQQQPSYGDVVAEVQAELLRSVEQFVARGVARENVVLDPGIGFAKRFEDNIELLDRLDRLCALEFPVLVGTSRKSFIGQITNRQADGRLWGTLGSVAAAYVRGARIFRVHDVEETVDMLTVLSTILGRGA